MSECILNRRQRVLQSLFACCAAWLLWQPAFSENSAAPRAGSPEDRAADFDQMWREVNESYVYLGVEAESWRDVRRKFAAQVESANTIDSWTSVLASALAELADFHIEVDPRPSDDWRPVPTCAMVWAEWRNGEALVTGVQPGSNAARAGILPGDIILKIGGRDVGADIPENAAFGLRSHLLLQHLAGRRDSNVDLDLRTPDKAVRSVRLASDCKIDRPEALVSSRRLPSGYGLIRFNNSFGNADTVTAFDQALATLRDVPGLIVDLRDIPSGGTSTVALGVLGRFVARRAPYQMHRIPNFGRPDVERVWLEEVTPRGPFQYTKPVVVLADHWTGSMGEGVAVGFDALHRAEVVGTSLGRLNGSVQTVTLEHTHVKVNIPEEQIFHVNGTPRHEWNPPVLVDLVAERGQSDAELAVAEKVLRNQLVKSGR
jgi:C-terminal processing protease CtpA/Prc